MCPEERRQYVNLHYFNTFFHKVGALKSIPFKFHSSNLIFQYQRPVLICAYYKLKLLQETKSKTLYWYPNRSKNCSVSNEFHKSVENYVHNQYYCCDIVWKLYVIKQKIMLLLLSVLYWTSLASSSHLANGRRAHFWSMNTGEVLMVSWWGEERETHRKNLHLI